MNKYSIFKEKNKMKRILSRILTLSMISCMSGLQNTYAIDNNNILKGVECGMTVPEVSETISYESVLQSESIVPVNDNLHYKYTNCYNIENVSAFNVDMKTLMFTEFAFLPNSGHSDSDILINYGYHIGEYYNPETQKEEYPYSESELISEYDNIYSKLSEWYGEGKEYSAGEYSNILKGYEWHTEYGDIWFIVGTDLWGSPGQNKITLSCSDFSVLDKILGDINGDSIIDASDASDILSDYANISSGGISTLDKNIADVNKDGKTDASDSSMILAYYAYTSSGGTQTIYKFRNI